MCSNSSVCWGLVSGWVLKTILLAHHILCREADVCNDMQNPYGWKGVKVKGQRGLSVFFYLSDLSGDPSHYVHCVHSFWRSQFPIGDVMNVWKGEEEREKLEINIKERNNKM